jgi:hypothetical protein
MLPKQHQDQQPGLQAETSRPREAEKTPSFFGESNRGGAADSAVASGNDRDLASSFQLPLYSLAQVHPSLA